MTILYKTVPIHECTEKLIINPMVKLHGYNIGHQLDDFILHEHHIVYEDFFAVQPDFGTVRYIDSGEYLFANAIVGIRRCLHSEQQIIKTLGLIRDFAIEADLLNDIAIDVYSFISIPGGEKIIKILKNIFPRDTITVYTGKEHFSFIPICLD